MNTFLFLIGGTVVNIIITAMFLLFGFFIVGRVVPEDVNPSAAQIIMLLVFVGALVGAFFVYNRLIKLLSAKIDMDKYFHPIFRPRGGKK